jgi:DNA-binding MarR family transcriptional regulator
MERLRNTPVPRWRADAGDLIGEITLAAECIGAACTPFGERVYPTDTQARLLRSIRHSPYCLSIADAARALGVSRQAAHRIAYRAAAVGRVDLLSNPDDQRILQIVLTAAGRCSLRAQDAIESTWLATLLNGLGSRERATAVHVVRVIRQRLERDARASRRQADSAKVVSNHLGDSS